MTQNYDKELQLVHEVLTGEMQERYAEAGHIQLHPNYYRDAQLAVYGTPRQTRAAVQAAFLLRWTGLNGRSTGSINESAIVPSLVDSHGKQIHYRELEPTNTFDLLRAIQLIESDKNIITPTKDGRKALLSAPAQTFTILPRRQGWRVILGPGLREAVRAHTLYTEAQYGETAYIPLGKTTNTTAVDRKRNQLHVVKDPESD
jgi:hypothetical protein